MKWMWQKISISKLIKNNQTQLHGKKIGQIAAVGTMSFLTKNISISVYVNLV